MFTNVHIMLQYTFLGCVLYGFAYHTVHGVHSLQIHIHSMKIYIQYSLDVHDQMGLSKLSQTCIFNVKYVFGSKNFKRR
jgi:hypothetical protein